MANCPAGHQTNQTDFCDVCGLPVVAEGQPVVAAAPQPQAALSCPNCAATNVADALFCESCGYDFTTGSMPAAAEPPIWPTLVPPIDPTPPAPVPDPLPEQAAPTAADAAAQPAPSVPSSVGEAAPQAEVPAAGPTAAPAPVAARRSVEWVAELWIDPDWYAAQGSTDPMPSVGLPDIVGLVKPANLIGRVSHSRGIFPDIDCELDSGCSRRHAMLTTDWTRWWIEDLNSANGTFVGSPAGPLPAMPIPQGRVELTDGQRIYVGAWTRIVIRKATDDEREALAG
jgi:hypothetical protein